jgi:thiol-disulfide isomerase/thioredoxin
MIIELTPEKYFDYVKKEGPLHVVMHYGANCGPCKVTMPKYEQVEEHFVNFKVINVKFYKFHHWEQDYRSFIIDNKLDVNGVPTFRYFYMGDIVNEEARSFTDADQLKKHITDTIKAIEITMEKEFNLYEG